MKKIIMILLSTIMIGKLIFAQTIIEEKKNRLIADLDSVHSIKCTLAIDQIIEYRILEALPKIEGNFWKVDIGDKALFLYALREFNSNKAYEFAKAYLDSLDIMTNIDTTNIYIDKCYAITILMNNNDFSYSDYILSLLCCDETHFKTALPLLGLIIKNDSANSQRAMNLLINTAKNAQINNVRASALFYYNNIVGKEALPVLIESYINDKDAEVRGRILNQYFFNEYFSPAIEAALRTRIQVEDSPINKSEAALILLGNYNSPINYKVISDLEKKETDAFTKKSLKTKLNSYIVKRPSDTLSVNSLIDSLFYYTTEIFDYTWLKDEGYKNNLLQSIQNARYYLSISDTSFGAKQIKFYQSSIQQVYSDSAGSYPKYVSEEAYKFLYYYPQYILERLPPIPSIKLKDSQGNLLPGGSLQYYDGGWKNAVDNGDGTFSVDTQLKTVSLRMTYGYASQTKSNISVASDTVVFQTVNTAVKLLDSNGSPADTGTVQYYAGGWRDFGKTENGTAYKELLPVNYTFRMNYGFAGSDKAQSLDTNSTVVFNTVNSSVRLQNSSGNPMDEGTVMYYAGGWRPFGITVNGLVNKELLPNNYTFRMNYAFAGNDKQQNIKDNPVVVFKTVNAGVQLKDSKGNLTDPGTVQYYSGGWRNFGTTSNGIARKELLPNNYTFRMSYAFSSKDKQQNVGTNSLVEFQTVNAEVQLRNSQNNLIKGGMVQYYSGGWRDFGAAAVGIANKELLANNYTFGMNYAFASNDKAQDLNANPVVVFKTVNTVAELRNSAGALIDEGTVQYYSGGWRSFGATIGGSVSKELLPNNYTFRMTHDFISNDKAQNTNTNSTVSFPTVQCTIRVMNTQNQPVSGAAVSYYSGGWRSLGTTLNGLVTREMLPANLTFRVNYNGTQQDKTQNLLNNNIVEFTVGQ